MLSALEKKRVDWLKKQKALAEGKYKRVKESKGALKVLNTLKQIEADILGLNLEIEALEGKNIQPEEVASS